MKKRKSYLIKVNNPCHADWSSMKEVSSGRFCSECSKTVVDLTKATDQELIAIIQSSGKICGRLNSYQINRKLIYTTETRRKPTYYLLTSLLLFTSPAIVKAKSDVQASVKLNTTEQELLAKKALKSNDEKPSEIKNEFKGIIVDETSEPIIGCQILIKNSNIKTTSSSKGKFKLLIPANQLKDNIVFVVSSLGHETKEIKVKRKNLGKPLKIVLKDSLFILGKIAVIETGE